MWRPNFSMGDLIALVMVIGTLLAVVGQAWINQAVGEEVQVQLSENDRALIRIQRVVDRLEEKQGSVVVDVEVIKQANTSQEAKLQEINQRLEFLITCEISGCAARQQ